MSSSSNAKPSLIWMLAGLISIGPLAVDTYLPAMPQMATGLGVALHQIEFTLSVYLLGFAIGQLVGGPLSDRYGRRITILGGLALFAGASLVAACSNQIEVLWAARLVQALGGGLGVVNTMAVLRDLYSGRESAQALSRVVSIMLAAPLLAPFIGSGLLLLSGWRSIFVALAAYAAFLWLVMAWKLPETHQAVKNNVNKTAQPSALQRYWSVLRHRPVLGFLAAISFSHASMFAFITGSSLLYMEYYGVSAQLFPVLFGLNIVTLTLCNRLNVALLNSYNPLTLLVAGQLSQLILGVVLLGAFLLLDPSLWVTLVLVMLFIGVQGLIMANGISSATEYFPQSAATTSAVMNASGFLAGAISGGLISLWGAGSPVALLWIMALSPVLGLISRWLLHRNLASYT